MPLLRYGDNTRGAALSIGFVELSGKGIKFKKMFKLAYEDENFEVGGGVGDIRNGISFKLGASASQRFEGEGDGLRNFLVNAKATGIAAAVLSPLIQQVNKILVKVLELTGIDARGDFPTNTRAHI